MEAQSADYTKQLDDLNCKIEQMKSQFSSEKSQIEKNAQEQIETIKTELESASGETQN